MAPSPDQYNGYDEFFTYYNKFRYPAFRYDFFAFNLKNKLFQDVRVRRAFAHAVNKKDIVDGVYEGYALPATGPLPPASWAFNPNVKDYDFDIAKASALLAEAGWKDTDGDGWVDKDGRPFEFTVITNQGNKVRESIAQIIQSNLQKIGVKMNIRIIEWSVFIHKYVDEKQFEAIILGWNLTHDPDAYSIWHSSQMKDKQYNFISYRNPEVDRLLEEGRRTFGVEKRRPIYHRIHELIAADEPYIFLVYPERLPLVHKKIAGVEWSLAGLGWNFNNWFIPKAWQEELVP
jgi:peptide/nickel transport system substrate-binding protein